MTKLEELLEWMNQSEYAPTYGELNEKVIQLIKEEKQVKSVDLADVVGRSEQLKPNGSYYTECECGNLVHAREKNCKKCGL